MKLIAFWLVAAVIVSCVIGSSVPRQRTKCDDVLARQRLAARHQQPAAPLPGQ